ncbi:hypothetical protein CDD81_2558 [Ophiocordyceps australis]|uniref:Xylanolytic transcriptional activator regulatory domain-containing protein n=1 Tax=Ophiocordyceps australis TaxID=1399860 RepID=A0A2C5X7K1_9HYPO|nr:hypothetical protein CDD81_2558 [Ophiocordyceps australis]
MDHHSPLKRTAPIAISSKSPLPGMIPNRQQDGAPRFEIGPSSLQTTDSISFPGSPAPPCQACRISDSRCAPGDDDDVCKPCQSTGTDCSLSNNSPCRKRKLNGENTLEVTSPGKRSSPNASCQPLPQSSSFSSTTGSGSFFEKANTSGRPSILKRSLGLQIDRYSQYIGSTTDFEPSLINLSIFDPQDESLLSRGALRKVSDDDTFLMLPDDTTCGYQRIDEDSDAIEAVVAPRGRRLIDLYFKVVHPAFPIIHKDVFLEKYEDSHRELSPPLLAAVYILAINWWEHDEELMHLPRPDVRELERLIRISLADAMNRPKLSTIQAGLLLSQRPEGDQWAPTAQLVAVGQELGLHLDCSGWKIPPWEKGLRRRLAWALYMQDKWGALVHGRPSHIFASNWGVRSLIASDFPDTDKNDGKEEAESDQEHEMERGRLIFTRHVQLSQILAEILETFYTLRSITLIASAGNKGTQWVLTTAKPMQLKLKEWFSGLPAMLRLETYSTSGSYASVTSAGFGNTRPSSIGFIHLAYFATEITLHRCIIRSLASNPSAVDPYVQHFCRSAAKACLISSMDFVNRLTPSHLRSFWYFASKTNFALIGTFGSLLWATSPGREEADWYRRRLGEYRWTLSVSSKPGEGKKYTEFAMTMLDMSTGLLNKLPEKPCLSRSESMANMPAFSTLSPFISTLPRSLPGSFARKSNIMGGGGVANGSSRLTYGYNGLVPSGDTSSVQSPDSGGFTSDDEDEDDDDMEDSIMTPM